jgi:hypothetical protein
MKRIYAAVIEWNETGSLVPDCPPQIYSLQSSKGKPECSGVLRGFPEFSGVIGVVWSGGRVARMILEESYNVKDIPCSHSRLFRCYSKLT